MGIKNREKARDGFFVDLPEDLQDKIVIINRLISSKVKEKIDDEHYEDLKSSNWAMSCLDDFMSTPSGKNEVGSVRVSKTGKGYKCTIIVTGHFRNHQYGWIEELLHELIKDTFQEIKPEVRKKHDVLLQDKGSMGSPDEGFAVVITGKAAQEMWDKLEDRKTKTVLENGVIINDDGEFEFDHRYFPEYTDDLIDYYENYRNQMTYDDYFQEKSHGKLNNSFRIAVNPENGHYIKIVFDLNPESILQVGDHAWQNGRDYEKDRKIINNIKNTGNTNFSSMGVIKAIVDLDTKQSLKSVKTVGVIGNDGTRLTVPDQFVDDKIPNDEKYSFSAYPVKTREQIAKHLKINAKDAITFTVGQTEHVPSYKSTVMARSIPGLYNNQWKAGRGVQQARTYRQRVNSDDNIKAAFAKLQKRLDNIKGLNGSSKLSSDIKDAERWMSKLKEAIDKNSSENFGQSVAHPVYNRYYRLADECITDLENDMKHVHESVDLPDYKKEYNVDMTEAQAKRTLRTLSQGIINDIKNKKDYKVTQYTANIYANIITKNLLPRWCSGYKKLSITLDSYQSFHTFEFKIPAMSQDFISRFINGREPINAFLHRVPEIKIKMSPRIFHTMQNPDDAFNFFKAAVKYYDSKVEKYSSSLTREIMRLNHSMKHLISTTKLSGIVTYPMQLLFVFDDVNMTNPKTFELTDSDINTVNQFIKNIYSRYAAPEKEKKQIIEDVKEMVKELREACDPSENMRDLYYLPEAVETYLTGGYDDLIKYADDQFVHEQVDWDEMRTPRDPEIKYIQEKFGVKKLKRIPTDLVAYITIETEAIETPNDKMMIASYTLSKIEVVEWYIELLEVGSKKYVVPHSKPYLENIRTQLLACYKKIMDTKVSSNKNRPIIDIQYPAGYEG